MIDDFQLCEHYLPGPGTQRRFLKKLGLNVISHIGELEADGIAQAFPLPTGSVRVVYLAPPNASGRMFVDLVQWLEPRCTGDAYHALNHVGINRLAFGVSDLDGTTAFLRNRGHHVSKPRAQAFGEGI